MRMNRDEEQGMVVAELVHVILPILSPCSAQQEHAVVPTSCSTNETTGPLATQK